LPRHFAAGIRKKFDWKDGGLLRHIRAMTETETAHVPNPAASMEQVQKGWHELTLRVSQLEVERTALEHENKNLRKLLERVIEHRQKSHGELVLLLTGLVSKLPINEVGVLIAKLMEHNTQVSNALGSMVNAKGEDGLPRPQILVQLDQVKRDLNAKIQPLIEELMQLEVPLENETLQSLVAKPENFFKPLVVRSTRCFLKGQVPRERVLREFGEAALIFFNDMTTDPKLNPRPKPDEIVLAFKTDFDLVLQQNPTVLPDKRDALQSLHKKVQQGKACSEQARLQKIAFAKLSFVLEVLHYYENQNTEVPEALFAQRLPGIVEQIAVKGPNDPAVTQISPSEHIDAITVPILLIHGKDDTVVAYQQSDTMAAALKRAGKNFEFVTLNREDHWLSRPETRTQMLQSSVAFLRKYNPPD